MKIPVLVTSCISPNAPLTNLSDENSRLLHTLKAIRELSKNADSIVICDGSDYDLTKDIHNDKQIINKDSIEIIHFKNDTESVKSYGKGYGEGEIIEYALMNSRYLSNAESFAKITSKLYVDNYKQCIKAFNGKAFFIPVPFLNENMIDTRFYVVNKKIYWDFFANSYKSVRDLDGVYLEHIFFEQIKNNKLKGVIGTTIPKIRGVSGTFNIEYSTDSKVKTLIKELRLKYIAMKNK